MANRVAGILSLVAFSTCLLIGAFEAGNAFGVVVYRALAAMLGTYVVGYVIGLFADRMIAENVAATEKRLVAERNEQQKNPLGAEDSATEGR